jgi:predicted alpha-1,6-mannanase (GH76 family)
VDIGRTFAAMNESVLNETNVNALLSGYFDDEEWWGLGWLRAFVVFKEERFLRRAAAVHADIARRAWRNSSCGGGVCWQNNNCYKGAITNSLFMTLSAGLALHSADGQAKLYYQQWAVRSWEWIDGAGLVETRDGKVGAGFLFNDGLDTFKVDEGGGAAIMHCYFLPFRRDFLYRTERAKMRTTRALTTPRTPVCFKGHEQICANNGESVYTYNQGVPVGGLAWLYALTKDEKYLARAVSASYTLLLLLSFLLIILVLKSGGHCQRDHGLSGVAQDARATSGVRGQRRAVRLRVQLWRRWHRVQGRLSATSLVPAGRTGRRAERASEQVFSGHQGVSGIRWRERAINLDEGGMPGRGGATERGRERGAAATLRPELGRSVLGGRTGLVLS